MNRSAVLCFSSDPVRQRRREQALRAAGFGVVSVNSPSEARYEIEMGECGAFIIGPFVSDLFSADLLKLFKEYCPDGLTVAILTRSLDTNHDLRSIDVTVPESDDPKGVVRVLRELLLSDEGVA